MAAVPEPDSLQLWLSSFVAIAAERSETAILERAVDLARLATRARYGAAATLDPAGGLALFVHQGLTAAQVAALPHPPEGRGMLAAVLEDKAPVRLDRLKEDPRSVAFPLHHVPMAAFLGVPVFSDADLLGGIYLTKAPGEGTFSEQDAMFIDALARQTGVALEAARLMAAKDGLNAELRAADRLKSDFVAMASHELRTPLTSIRAATAMVRAYWDSASDQRKLDLLDTVEGQAQRLSRLIENLLAAANLETGQVRAAVQPVALTSVAEAAARDFLGQADVAVDAPEPLVGLIDPQHVRQIVVNLVGNALKYGEPPFVIRCRLDGDAVEIAVCDEGPGVPEDFVPHLFERFTQASSGDERRASGSGLGLSIALGLADASGATLRYEPNPPRGARFILRMPSAT